MSECSTVCHVSRLVFHPTRSPDLLLLEAAAGHNQPFTCRCTTRHSFYLLKCIQVDSQIICCRDDTDKQAHFYYFFSKASGPVCHERALFTGGVPYAHLGTCPADSWAGPLWTLRFEWRSLWIQSSVEVVLGTRLFSHWPSPSVFCSVSCGSYYLAASTVNIVHLH